MKKILFIQLAITLIVSCGKNSKKKEENIPYRLVQVWDQSKCEVCDDPWREWNEKIDDYTNLISLKDKYGDKSMTAESYVFFKNVPLTYAEGYKSNASYRISYEYYAKNCWGAEWRDAYLDLGSPGYWSEKNVEWIKNANNGDRFDVLMYQPKFEQENPSNACDYTSFDVVPANYGKIVVFPAGELNIKQTGNYKFKGTQGDFELVKKDNLEESLNIENKKSPYVNKLNDIEESRNNISKIALINVDNLNFRSSPEISDNIIGTLKFEEKVIFVDSISIESNNINNGMLNKKIVVDFKGQKYNFNKHKVVEIDGPDGDYALVVNIEVGNGKYILASIPTSDIDLSNKKTWARIKKGNKTGYIYYDFLNFIQN